MKQFIEGVLEKTKIELYSKINITRIKSLNSQKIKIPIINGIGRNNLSVSEIWMIELLRKLLKHKQGIFIDIGVNLGQTLIKLRVVDSTVGYIGFEPNPVCVFYVKELIKANNFLNSTVIPIGLFNSDRLLQLDFFDESEIDSSASLIEGFRNKHKIYHRQFVPVFSFESIVSKLTFSDIAIIKIDVEGSELEVIEGLYQTILTYQPVLILEILPVHSSKNTMRKERQDKIEQIFSALSYRMFRVIKTGTNELDELQEVNTIGIHSNLEQCDYVAIPKKSDFFNEFCSS
jgi:FkbM family methyltransferase